MPSQHSEIPEAVRPLVSVMSFPPSEKSVREANILAYVGRYVCRNIWRKVRDECKVYLRGKIDESNESKHFLTEIRYSDTKGEGLFVPTSSFLSMPQQMEEEFRRVFSQLFIWTMFNID